MSNRFKPTVIAVATAMVFGAAVGFGATSVAQPIRSQAAAAIDSETQLLHTIYAKVNPSVVSIQVRIPVSASSASQGLPQGFPKNLLPPNFQAPDNSQQPDQQAPQPNQQAPQGNQYEMAAGSGFVFDTNADIVTNAHVVNGADKITVIFSDGNELRAKVVGIDTDADVAVIKAEGDLSKYAPLTIADSDAVTVGDRAIAIGNPFERAGTMTRGIVSGIHRSVQGTIQNYVIPDAIQTDASINPGNSGGPLLNSDGDVIGINQQIASEVRQSSGVGFAIPSNLVKLVADTLIKDGKMQHSYLGIAGGTVDLDVSDALKLPAQTHGAYVSSVVANGPAAKAGLKGAVTNKTQVDTTAVAPGGDIITAIDGQPVHAFEDLTSYLFIKTKVGQEVTLTILRDGKSMDIKVTLGARPVAN